MKLDKLEAYLDTIEPPLKEHKRSTLSSMFYDIYLEGIEEGKNQIKNKLVNNLLLLIDTDK